MSNDTQSFRSAVLGFDRNDVINYIETLTREHQEEIAAFRNAAEILRRERDEARRRIEGQENQIEHLREDSGEMARLSREMETHRVSATETGAKLGEVEQALRRAESEIADLKARKEAEAAGLKARAASELAALRTQIESEAAETRARQENEIAGLRAQNEELTRQYEAINSAKLRADDMEMMAYKRAKEIEDEAAQKAERAHAALSRLIRDTKGKYSVAKGDMETVAYNTLVNLNNMRDWFNNFPRLFDEIDDMLDSIADPDSKAPIIVKPAPPETLSAAGTEPASGEPAGGEPASGEPAGIPEEAAAPPAPGIAGDYIEVRVPANGQEPEAEPKAEPEPEPPKPAEPPFRGDAGQADTSSSSPPPLDPSARLSVIIQKIGTEPK